MINVDLKALLKDDISRYSLVVATAKRARDIADAAKAEGEILVEKPVSLAVEDFQDGKYIVVESAEVKEF
ncbi:MAG: DNA-directed RNA polymerase subunit omega [Clostridia bacterium]|nr:DNA-directed RNA polymerase subunit omega [Clostridia bacterium]